MTQPACPECEKLAKVAPQINKIGEFLDWLEGEKIYLDMSDTGTYRNTEQLLADFFEINLALVEKERRALLEHMRENI